MSAASTGSSGRLVELDAFRGLLALLVVTFHAYQPSSGDPGPGALPLYSTPDILVRGVDALLPMFFVLSGFAVMLGVARAVLAGKPLPSAGSFLFQRALRLLPVYLLVVLIVWEVRYAGTTEQWTDLLRALTFTQIYSDDTIFRLVGPAWYLCVEWHWYAAFALLGLPVARWAARADTPAARVRRLSVIPVTLALAGTAWKGVALARGVPFDSFSTWFAPPAWGISFALGSVLGLWLAVDPTPRARDRVTRLGLGAIAVGLALWTMSVRGTGTATSVAYFELGAVACTVALVGTILSPAGGHVRRTLRLPPLLWLAGISYSLYICHDPLLRGLASIDVLRFDDARIWVLTLLASVAVAIVAGWLATMLVERPAVRIGRLFRSAREAAPRLKPAAGWTDTTGYPLPAARLVRGDGDAVDPHALLGPGGMVVFAMPDEPLPLGADRLAGSARLLRDARDSAFAFRARDVAVVAVRRGAAGSADHTSLPFPVLRDPDGSFLAGLGVAQVRAGRIETSERAAVLVGGDGLVTLWHAEPEIDGEVRRLINAVGR